MRMVDVTLLLSWLVCSAFAWRADECIGSMRVGDRCLAAVAFTGLGVLRLYSASAAWSLAACSLLFCWCSFNFASDSAVAERIE